MKLTEEQIIEGLEGVLDELRNPPDGNRNRWRREQAESLAWLAREIEPGICTVRFEFDIQHATYQRPEESVPWGVAIQS